MSTLFYGHNDFLKHDTGIGHPENADRLRSISKALKKPGFSRLIRKSAAITDLTLKAIHLIHSPQYVETILNSVPEQDYYQFDDDTVLSPGSGIAALRAVATLCDAVDKICLYDASNAFCAIRPPGHHATPSQAMGFCLFNNIAIAAEYARKHYHINRVAIVDFDVHHGNGTQAAFINQPDVLYISSHEMPNYPGTGYASETGAGNIINIPLKANTAGTEFRKKYTDIVIPALNSFKPELLLISAGFDAHKKDPLASISLIEDDYRWLTEELMIIADNHSDGRVLSALEGPSL
jgi:acetoin utilization deacetylase AcuC-like enzyme